MEGLIKEVEGYVMPYGKHKGVPINTLLTTEPSYLDWLAENSRDPIFKYALNKYLDKKGEK